MGWQMGPRAQCSPKCSPVHFRFPMFTSDGDFLSDYPSEFEYIFLAKSPTVYEHRRARERKFYFHFSLFTFHTRWFDDLTQSNSNRSLTGLTHQHHRDAEVGWRGDQDLWKRNARLRYTESKIIYLRWLHRRDQTERRWIRSGMSNGYKTTFLFCCELRRVISRSTQ